jgi:Protein of unknown function (DUF2726)
VRIKNSVVNVSEEIVLKELSSITTENNLRVFAKLRLQDVIDNDGYLDGELFSFYTRAHFDFTVTTPEAKPVMTIEYDGPFHRDPEQIARDIKKHRLCKEAGLPILRINANHVMRRYRGMNLLRWIIEVIQLEKSFNEAQDKGEIPFDESFDPLSILSDGSDRGWPYWLSTEAVTKINKFRRNSPGTTAWISLIGADDDKRLHSLEYLRLDDHVLWVRTSVRNQDADIDQFQMITEVTHCEMGEQLTGFLRREQILTPIKEFQAIHDEVCLRYKMHAHATSGSGLDVPG